MKTIYHVVMPDNTVTFLTDADRRAWLTGFEDNDCDGVLCESQVTETVYGQLVEWRTI